MSALHVTIVIPPGQGEGEVPGQVLNVALSLTRPQVIDVLVFTGNAHPAAVATRSCERLGQSSARHLILLPTGVDSEVIAAIVAHRLGGASLGRCSNVAVDGEAIEATRPAFGGRLDLVVRSQARITCATVRPMGAAAVAADVGVATTQIQVQEPWPFQAQVLPVTDPRPRVEGADLVVAGGRGIGGAEGFVMLERIAAALGAGLGGSLPAVDAGWLPVAHQVGQSGKFVTPRLYFAVGISGTPQHLAGVSPQARIVALNSDADAPIFHRCDVGVHGDWREILPLLAHHLEVAAKRG